MSQQSIVSAQYLPESSGSRIVLSNIMLDSSVNYCSLYAKIYLSGFSYKLTLRKPEKHLTASGGSFYRYDWSYPDEDRIKNTGIYSFDISLHSRLFDSLHIDIFESPIVMPTKLVGMLVAPICDLITDSTVHQVNASFPLDFISSDSSGQLSFTLDLYDYSVPSDHSSLASFEMLSFPPSPDPTLAKFVHLPYWLRPLSLFLDAPTIQGVHDLYTLLNSYGKGLGISNTNVASALALLTKFYDARVPIQYSKNYVKDLEFISFVQYLYRYTIASYGWMGMSYFGKGNGIFRDFLKSDADRKLILEYLLVAEEDLIEVEFSVKGPFKPRYFILHDRIFDVLIFSIRGSMSASDWVTSLAGHYIPFKGGFSHKGFLEAGQFCKSLLVSKVLPIAKARNINSVIILGHSLGGACSAFSKVLYEDDLESRALFPDISVEVYAFGCPPIFSKELIDKYAHIKGLYSFLYGNDFSGHVSYGSLMDFRPLLLKAAEFSKIMHMFQNIDETFEPTFDALEKERLKIIETNKHPKLLIPGKLYYIYDIESEQASRSSDDIAPRPKQRLKKSSDKAPKLKTVMEETDSTLFTELQIRNFMMAHHMPDMYENALHNATLTLSRNLI